MNWFFRFGCDGGGLFDCDFRDGFKGSFCLRCSGGRKICFFVYRSVFYGRWVVFLFVLIIKSFGIFSW